MVLGICGLALYGLASVPSGGITVAFWSAVIRICEPCRCICPKSESSRQAQAPVGTAIAYVRQFWYSEKICSSRWMVERLGSGLCLVLIQYIIARILPKRSKVVLFETSSTIPGMYGGRSICWRQVA